MERARERRLEAAGIPPRYQRSTLGSFDGAVSPSASRGLMMAQAWVWEWTPATAEGLLLTGTVGTGKTHLGVGILLEVHRVHGARIRFAELRALFAQIKDGFGAGDERGEMATLRPLLEADVLLVDEIGASRDTEWQRECLEKLVNGRYNAARPTIFTTNYPNLGPGQRGNVQPIRGQSAPVSSYTAQAQAQMQAAVRPETLGDRIGAPMWSRLQEMCRCVEFAGEDVRTTRRKA